MTSLRILLTAWPRWIAPFAYGGPSCSTNGSRPFAFSRRRAYRPSDSQRSRVTGSRLGRSPRLGNSVAGRCRAALYGLSGFVVLYALKMGRAEWREEVVQYVLIPGVAVSIKKKQ